MTTRSSWLTTRSSLTPKERSLTIRRNSMSTRRTYVILAKCTCKAIGRFSRRTRSRLPLSSSNGLTTIHSSFACSLGKTQPNSVSLGSRKDTRSDGSWKSSNCLISLVRLQSQRQVMICKRSSAATHLTISNGQTSRACTNAPMSWRVSNPTAKSIWTGRTKWYTSHGEDPWRSKPATWWTSRSWKSPAHLFKK